MKNIDVVFYSCNKLTYEKIYRDVIEKAFATEGISIDKDDSINVRIIDLSKYGTKRIQSQRSPRGEHCRAIYVYCNGKIKYMIGISNTNFDEDVFAERMQTKERKIVYGGSGCHANTYLEQGINKIFLKYFMLKKQNKDLKLFFYLLDLKQTHPHNMFNLFSYRLLDTIGFKILNIDGVDFSKFRELGFSKGKATTDISYKSFNKLMNDQLFLSSKNSSNIPSYLRCEETIDKNDPRQYMVEKYIFTFKALGANAYHSLMTIWALSILAKKEKKKLEFLFSKEMFGFRHSKTMEQVHETTDLPKPVRTLLEHIGINITYETSEEILQQFHKEQEQFKKAKKCNEIRNQSLFRNNIRKKGIQMKCFLCGCEIENLLDAAHLWGISQIKDAKKNTINDVLKKPYMKDLLEDEDYINDIFYKRYVLANSGDNGVWLCKNHHGMFDSHYYCFDTQFGKVIYKINISNTEKKDISSKMISDTIPDEIMTDKTKEFLNQRQKALEACNILFCY